ncbi:MAG TPA: tetratricopeptide repeat-containing glycosyltransferase family protein [Steroidobacteraceae bacterium]|nr:tetratricopeptide repeat-containing glycosyltransferase family protein [Steroidobacteraceae bacterium]
MTEDPTFARAVELHRRGDIGAAEQLYQQILRLKPRHAGALHLLGSIHLQRGQLTEALAACEAALAADPRNAAAHQTQGDALHDLGRQAEAVAAYDRCLALDPRSFVAWSNRGSALLRSRRFEEAAASYERALALPGKSGARVPQRWLANPWLNRGAALQELGRFEAALQSFDRAIAADPALAQAHSNRGCTLDCLGRPQEALASCERAIALQPDYAAAHLNRGMALLRLGRFPEGWAEYEWRWRNTQSAISRDRRRTAAPLWLGREPLKDRTILLHAEQGYGDTLQFCRYAPLVRERGARVILEVHPALECVMSRLEGVSQVISPDEPLREVDFQTPLMSLPLAFGTTLDTIPAGKGYLTAEPERIERWRRHLGERRGLRVGLAWSGGFRPHEPEYWSANARRNIDLRKLSGLEHPRIEYVSLQKGQPEEAGPQALQQRPGWRPRLIDEAQRLSDFAETAALIENLDLVVSVDTATAHLSAALGKPTWILSRFDGCWRWLQDRSDSPWYPSVRLFRQQAPGTWDPVIEQVREELFRLAG